MCGASASTVSAPGSHTSAERLYTLDTCNSPTDRTYGRAARLRGFSRTFVNVFMLIASSMRLYGRTRRRRRERASMERAEQRDCVQHIDQQVGQDDGYDGACD